MLSGVTVGECDIIVASIIQTPSRGATVCRSHTNLVSACTSR